MKAAEYGVADGFYCLRSVSVAIASVKRTKHAIAGKHGAMLSCPITTQSAHPINHTTLYSLPIYSSTTLALTVAS